MQGSLELGLTHHPSPRSPHWPCLLLTPVLYHMPPYACRNDGQLVAPTDIGSAQQLLQEAEYYQLQDLARQVQEHVMALETARVSCCCCIVPTSINVILPALIGDLSSAPADRIEASAAPGVNISRCTRSNWSDHDSCSLNFLSRALWQVLHFKWGTASV